MKNILMITLLLISFSLIAQDKELKIETIFYVNNKSVKGDKYYFIKNDGKAYLLPTEKGRIILKDTLTTKGVPPAGLPEVQAGASLPVGRQGCVSYLCKYLSTFKFLNTYLCHTKPQLF